jgi:predicted transcriptional regulator
MDAGNRDVSERAWLVLAALARSEDVVAYEDTGEVEIRLRGGGVVAVGDEFDELTRRGYVEERDGLRLRITEQGMYHVRRWAAKNRKKWGRK